MPILASDLQILLSGGAVGAGNTDPNASLGGVITSTLLDTSNTLNNLFDDVNSSESDTGDTEYRCIYLKNNHPTLTLQNAAIYITFQTPSTDTNMAIGLEPGAVNTTAQVIADEDTAPTGITFETGTGSNNQLTVVGNDILPGEAQALWIRRFVGVGAAAYASDSVVIRFLGDTLP